MEPRSDCNEIDVKSKMVEARVVVLVDTNNEI